MRLYFLVKINKWYLCFYFEKPSSRGGGLHPFAGDFSFAIYAFILKSCPCGLPLDYFIHSWVERCYVEVNWITQVPWRRKLNWAKNISFPGTHTVLEIVTLGRVKHRFLCNRGMRRRFAVLNDVGYVDKLSLGLHSNLWSYPVSNTLLFWKDYLI